MSERLSEIRAQKFLTLFSVEIARTIGALVEPTISKTTANNYVTNMENKFNTEIERSNRDKESVFESSLYTPALDACEEFLENYRIAKDSNEAKSICHDALKMLNTYSDQI